MDASIAQEIFLSALDFNSYQLYARTHTFAQKETSFIIILKSNITAPTTLVAGENNMERTQQGNKKEIIKANPVGASIKVFKTGIRTRTS